MITAQVIADSTTPQNIRLTTLSLRYPKFIHGEFMTHRVFSRNASSSRAIPTARLLEEVRSPERAAPIFWGKNQKGMSAAEELEEDTYRNLAKEVWCQAALDAAHRAQELLSIGAHKQIVNRILEPFLHINVVVTATEWENFFALRIHPAAQPEMRELAVQIRTAMEQSTPLHREPGMLHTPFVTYEDSEAIRDAGIVHAIPQSVLYLRVSVARCARVSYQSHATQKRSTVKEDLELYDQLRMSGHWSPFEHQATPDAFDYPPQMGWENKNEHGNFRGWRQYRKLLGA